MQKKKTLKIYKYICQHYFASRVSIKNVQRLDTRESEEKKKNKVTNIWCFEVFACVHEGKESDISKKN